MPKTIILLLSICFIASAVCAIAQQAAVLTPNDGIHDDNYLIEVDIHNDYALLSNANGAAYVYYKRNGVWEQQAKLLPDENYFQSQNVKRISSLAIHDDFAILGYSAAGTDNVGLAFIYHRRDDSWEEETILTGDNTRYGSFGAQVELFESKAIVGQPHKAIYIFEKTNGIWQRTKEIYNDGNRIFPRAVCISDSFAIVTSQHQNIPRTDVHRGFVYVYKKTSSGWIFETRIESPYSDYDWSWGSFGWSISLNSNQILIGAPTESVDGLFGATYLYRRGSAGWQLQQRLVPQTYTHNNQARLSSFFGPSLALGEAFAIIAAPENFVGSLRQSQGSAAYLYRSMGDSLELITTFTNHDNLPIRGFGFHVALSDSSVILGGHEEEDYSGSPSAYVYSIPNVVTSIHTSSYSFPTSFYLWQNYPNPFNPKTIIQYQLSEQTHVKLEIFNLLGEHVITLVDETKHIGKHSVEWIGKNSQGHIASSGVFFYRITAGSFVQAKKLILIR